MTAVTMPSPDLSPLGSTARPRLQGGVPVMPLLDGTLQVGCDADRGLRLPGGDDAVLRLLRDLTGAHSVPELAQRCGLSTETVDEVLLALHNHRLLADDAAVAVPLDGIGVVRVVGGGRVAVDVVLALLAAGVDQVRVVDPQGASTDLADVVRRRSTNPASIRDRLRVTDHLDRHPLPAGTPTVLAPGRLEADPATVEALVRRDDPHVVVRPRPGAVLLGPFVLPGRTSCLTCADLTRGSRDATWIQQRAALTGTRAEVPVPLVPWAVSVLVAQLACWAVGGSPDLVDRTVEMELRDWRQRWRGWRPHPRCGCGWGGQSIPAGASSPPSSSTMVGSAMIRSTDSP